MKALPLALLTLLLSLSVTAGQNQNANVNAAGSSNRAKAASNRKPVFRATSDQIKQAQSILKQRGFYSGDATGKLDDSTRAGLTKYQQAESLKSTGTLNKTTLEKMGIVLTEKQKAM